MTTNNNSTEKKELDDIIFSSEVDDGSSSTSLLNAIISESPSSLSALPVGQVEPSTPPGSVQYERFWSCSSEIDALSRLEIVDEISVNESTAESIASASNRTTTTTTNRKYRIHIGTRPGFYTSELFTYEESEWRHKQLIDLLSQFQYSWKKAFIETCQFDIELKNAFSTTEAWGLEPYASIIFKSTEFVRVEGVAAIIGQIFRQDGIGIFDEEDDYHEQSIGTNVDNFDIHQSFVISLSDDTNEMSIPGNDAKKIMTIIRQTYPHLSGQFGRTNQTIELHDFCNVKSDITADHIRKILIEEKLFYEVTNRKSKSKLLWHENYANAIKQADFQLLADTINIVRLHDTMYNNN